jgi:hypothetical protein
MNSYYKVRYREDYYAQGFGTVVSPQDWWNEHRYFIERGKSITNNIEIPVFQLEKGKFADYMDNDCGFNLCSERLMNLIENFKSNTDLIEWYEVQVQGEFRQLYYILHLPVVLDILDEDRTLFHNVYDDDGTFIDKIVIKPQFKLEGLIGHNIFSYVGSDISWYVSENIKTAIIMQDCTGLELSEIHLHGV